MESTCLEAGATDVSATTAVSATTKSATTAVPSRPRYRRKRHGCDANYQID
jgi:hypothetical protein